MLVGEKLENQRGAAAILAVMGLLIGITFLITNTSDRLSSIATINVFIDKREESKKIINDIKTSLNSIATCQNSISRLDSDLNIIKDEQNNIIFRTYYATGAKPVKDILYKNVKIAKMRIRDKLEESKPNFNLATAYMDVYLADKSSFTQGMRNCLTSNSTNPENCAGVKKESIKIQLELTKAVNSAGKLVSGTFIKSCSTSLPALKQLTCEPVQTSVTCGSFVYYINVGEGQLGDKKSINLYPILPSINNVEYAPNFFGDTAYLTGFSTIYQIKLILFSHSSNPHLSGYLLKPSPGSVSPAQAYSFLEKAIKTRMYQYERGIYTQPYNGGAYAECSNGVWSVYGECKDVWP